ncbi:MAG: hypothetical protein V3U49_06605 [Nitrososphaerales archaeon]
MLGESFLALSESGLHLAGGLVGFSVARVARQGYKETSSPALYRLSIAFILLGFGLTMTGVTGLIEISSFGVFALVLSLTLSVAAILETGGYFFLALSQGIKARSSANRGFLAGLAIPTVSVFTLLRSLSFIFLLYGMLETLLSYFERKKRVTLMIASALGLLALGEFTRWLALFNSGVSPLLLISILLKLFGFFMLYTPVLKFSSFKGIPQFANL